MRRVTWLGEKGCGALQKKKKKGGGERLQKRQSGVQHKVRATNGAWRLAPASATCCKKKEEIDQKGGGKRADQGFSEERQEENGAEEGKWEKIGETRRPILQTRTDLPHGGAIGNASGSLQRRDKVQRRRV